MIDKASIGKQLKELRKGRGWTQFAVADKVGLSRPTISNIESGKRALTLNTLKKFCELYSIDISYFGIDTDNYDEIEDLTTRLDKIFKSNMDDSRTDCILFLYATVYITQTFFKCL